MSRPSTSEEDRRVREAAENVARILQPLDQLTRARALGAAICLTDTEVAMVAINAFMQREP